MDQNHSCLVLKPRATDWMMGDGNIDLEGMPLFPSGSSLADFYFFERQLLTYGDTNGCVLFTGQEIIDALWEAWIQAGIISVETNAWANSLGFMDIGTDGKKHFHSSPRWLEIKTGNGLNGNSVPESFDAAKQYGILPYADLPVDLSMTPQQYIDSSAITPAMADKAFQFLAGVGGKLFLKYQWVNNGTADPAKRIAALPYGPLALGVNVGSDWNEVQPPAPVSGENPGHCVALFAETLANGIDEADVFDHYLPNPKKLINWDIRYALQAFLTITPPPPAPTLPANPTPAQTSTWLQALVNWLQGIIGGLGKVETSNKQMQISAFEQAALHVCKVAAWVIGSAAIPALLTLYTGNPYWLALTPFINGIGAGLVKWSGIQAAAAAAKQPSAQ